MCGVYTIKGDAHDKVDMWSTRFSFYLYQIPRLESRIVLYTVVANHYVRFRKLYDQTNIVTSYCDIRARWFAGG